MSSAKDVSNRFLSIEIAIPFVVILIGGLVGYGSLSADVDHKAEKTDVEVVKNEVEHIKEDLDEIKEEQKEQRQILDRIDRKLPEN